MYKVKYFKENLIDEKIIDELAYIKNNDLLYNLSNLNIPSRVIYYYDENDEKIISEIDYLYNGRFHRENGPAKLFLYDNGNIKEEHYYRNGEFYPDSKGVTIRKFFKNGALKSTCEQIKDNYIKITNYNKSDLKVDEKYYFNGNLHKVDGPAMIIYYNDGKTIKEQYWYRFGKLHRLYEPAVQYDNNGNVISSYYIDGIKFEDILKHAIVSATFENNEINIYINNNLV